MSSISSERREKAFRAILSLLVVLTLCVTLVAPVSAQQGDTSDPQGIEEFWEDFYGFTILTLGFVGLLALASRSLTVASFGVYTTFAYIATETGDQTLMDVLVATLVLVFIAGSFKLWRLEGVGQ